MPFAQPRQWRQVGAQLHQRLPSQSELKVSQPSVTLEKSDEQFSDFCNMLLCNLPNMPFFRNCCRRHAEIKRLAISVAIIGIKCQMCSAYHRECKSFAGSSYSRRARIN